MTMKVVSKDDTILILSKGEMALLRRVFRRARRFLEDQGRAAPYYLETENEYDWASGHYKALKERQDSLQEKLGIED